MLRRVTSEEMAATGLTSVSNAGYGIPAGDQPTQPRYVGTIFKCADLEKNLSANSEKW